MRRSMTLILLTAAAVAAISPLAGCRGDRTEKPPRRFFPGMDDQPKWDAQEQTDIYEDERTLRPRVEGTVAYADWDIDYAKHSDEAWAAGLVSDRAELLREDDRIFRGVEADGEGGERWLKTIPMTVTSEMILEGQEQFNIYCAACHGYDGRGAGTVGQRWSYAPANLHADAYKDPELQTGQDGYLFHVILKGVGEDVGDNNLLRMPGYDHALSEAEAWAIVAYMRVLQRSRDAELDDIPDAATRSAIERRLAMASAEPAATDDSAAAESEPADSDETQGGDM